jgi:hypothetical protein
MRIALLLRRYALGRYERSRVAVPNAQQKESERPSIPNGWLRHPTIKLLGLLVNRTPSVRKTCVFPAVFYWATAQSRQSEKGLRIRLLNVLELCVRDFLSSGCVDLVA